MIDVKNQRDAMSQKKVPDVAADGCITDRRDNERRTHTTPVTLDRRTGEERRDNSGKRRRLIDPTTCERDYTGDEIEFMRAMDQYKRDNRRPFPTWSETLEVLRAIGYRKLSEPTNLPGLTPVLPPESGT